MSTCHCRGVEYRIPAQLALMGSPPLRVPSRPQSIANRHQACGVADIAVWTPLGHCSRPSTCCISDSEGKSGLNESRRLKKWPSSPFISELVAVILAGVVAVAAPPAGAAAIQPGANILASISTSPSAVAAMADNQSSFPASDPAPPRSALEPSPRQTFRGMAHADNWRAPRSVAIADVAETQPAHSDREELMTTSLQRSEKGPRVFLEVAVDGEDKGRIVIQLYDDVPVGTARFADLARGIQGVGFRRTKFDAVNQDFIQDAGLRRLNFGSERETPIAGGDGIDQLEFEMESGARHRHESEGDVSIVVRSGTPQQTKEKLVAYRGKLVKVQESVGIQPNGTAFAISLRPAAALDATNLVVGRVVEGMSVVKALADLPTVQNNSDSGYIKTAKFLGDKRADVAIRSFGRPFAKIVVTACGPLESLQ